MSLSTSDCEIILEAYPEYYSEGVPIPIKCCYCDSSQIESSIGSVVQSHVAEESFFCGVCGEELGSSHSPQHAVSAIGLANSVNMKNLYLAGVSAENAANYG